MDKLDDGCLPVSAPGLHGRHGRGCQPLLDVFPLYMCFRISYVFFVLCVRWCVCVCVRLCFHGFRARYFMTYRRIFHAIAIVLLGNTTTVNYDAIHLKRWQWQGHIDAEGKLWHTKFCGARITICQNSLKIYDYGCF